ncbi:LacI family DNA-binding transcriptional regulator [Rhodoferax sp. WC2427]|uniref:LacI family DNA-binding transcriptional regulator n=1 Tax=Rhodoferax sp. WC2427 TaxID=3234144 RepID=UPI0034678227
MPTPSSTRSQRMQAPTMRDVAKAAGVSQTAVSFVLNGRADKEISKDTSERIWAAIRALGYRPNAVAQSLRLGRSSLLGLVTDEIASTPFAVDIVRGAQDAAWAGGRILTLVNTNRQSRLESEAVAALVQHQVEGIIFAMMYHQEIVLPPVLGPRLPVALVNCFSADPATRCVVPDEELGGYTAVQHLVRHGHRRIGFINNIDPIPATAGRLAGYCRALQEAHIPARPEAVAQQPSSQEGGFDGTLQLMALTPAPTALFCFNDQMAMGAYAALQTLGLRIPEDVSVVGFDDLQLIAPHLRPALTTMALPHYAMGRWGVDVLFDPPQGPSKTLMACALVERASVAAPRDLLS